MKFIYIILCLCLLLPATQSHAASLPASQHSHILSHPVKPAKKKKAKKQRKFQQKKQPQGDGIYIGEVTWLSMLGVLITSIVTLALIINPTVNLIGFILIALFTLLIVGDIFLFEWEFSKLLLGLLYAMGNGVPGIIMLIVGLLTQLLFIWLAGAIILLGIIVVLIHMSTFEYH